MKKAFLPLLIDLDGVLKLGQKPAPGAERFINYIESNNVRACILTNTTQLAASEIKEYFAQFGIKVNIPIITAADATLSYVKENYKTAAVYAMPKVKALFNDIIDYDKPEVVVMGDLQQGWNYEVMNEIFNLAMRGIPIVAMQKNKYWKTPEEGLLMDLGAIVKAVEYAADVEALLIGKPSLLYFKQALKIMGVNHGEEFLSLGDDVVNDILPIQQVNGKGILIYTGKTEYPFVKSDGLKPDYEAKDLTEAIVLLERL